jgi:hypothetical protein
LKINAVNIALNQIRHKIALLSKVLSTYFGNLFIQSCLNTNNNNSTVTEDDDDDDDENDDKDYDKDDSCRDDDDKKYDTDDDKDHDKWHMASIHLDMYTPALFLFAEILRYIKPPIFYL